MTAHPHFAFTCRCQHGWERHFGPHGVGPCMDCDCRGSEVKRGVSAGAKQQAMADAWAAREPVFRGDAAASARDHARGQARPRDAPSDPGGP